MARLRSRFAVFNGRFVARPAVRWACCLLPLAGCSRSGGAAPSPESAAGTQSSSPAIEAPRQEWHDESSPELPALPDWSTAGFEAGAPLPERSATHSVVDYGARPDDGRDDTAAFRAALADLATHPEPVVLRVPAGRFLLADILFVERDQFVLQGEGSNETTLQFVRPLAQMEVPPRIDALRRYLRDNDKTIEGDYFSEFSWTGGVIWTRVPHREIELARRAPLQNPRTALRGQRGEHELVLEQAEGLEEGRTYVLRWFNREGQKSTFLSHMYGTDLGPWGTRLTDDPERTLVEQDVTVERIEGDRVFVRQPLLHDVRPEWRVAWGEVERLENVGFERFRVLFPDQAYAGHHEEAGYNGFHLNDLRQSWLRDVVVENADSGVLSDRSSHVTLEEVRVVGRPGHYGMHCGSVYGWLARDFEVDPGFAHAISFNTGCSGSVFYDGTIHDSSLDQHRGANHQNLFDSIEVKESDTESRVFAHGGAGYWGPPHGAFNTFANIRVSFPEGTTGPVHLGSLEGAGPAYIWGLSSNAVVRFDYEGATVQPQVGDKASVYLHQRKNR